MIIGTIILKFVAVEYFCFTFEIIADFPASQPNGFTVDWNTPLLSINERQNQYPREWFTNWGFYNIIICIMKPLYRTILFIHEKWVIIQYDHKTQSDNICKIEYGKMNNSFHSNKVFTNIWYQSGTNQLDSFPFDKRINQWKCYFKRSPLINCIAHLLWKILKIL